MASKHYKIWRINPAVWESWETHPSESGYPHSRRMVLSYYQKHPSLAKAQRFCTKHANDGQPLEWIQVRDHWYAKAAGGDYLVIWPPGKERPRQEARVPVLGEGNYTSRWLGVSPHRRRTYDHDTRDIMAEEIGFDLRIAQLKQRYVGQVLSDPVRRASADLIALGEQQSKAFAAITRALDELYWFQDMVREHDVG